MFKKIQEDRLAVMGKDKIKYNLLSVLIGEIQRTNTKEVSDVEVVKQLKKLLSNIDFSIEKGSNVEQSIVERDIIMSYLPKQLTDEELMDIMKEQIQQDPSMKERKNMFPFLKKNYDGTYDGAQASAVFSKL